MDNYFYHSKKSCEYHVMYTCYYCEEVVYEYDITDVCYFCDRTFCDRCSSLCIYCGRNTCYWYCDSETCHNCESGIICKECKKENYCIVLGCVDKNPICNYCETCGECMDYCRYKIKKGD